MWTWKQNSEREYYRHQKWELPQSSREKNLTQNTAAQHNVNLGHLGGSAG